MTPARKANSGQLVFGLLLLALGLLWTLDTIQVLDVHDFWRYWPLFLVAHGVGRLMTPPAPNGSRHGMFTVLLGLWLLANTLELLWWDTSWPLLVIALGLSIVWKALAEHDRASGAGVRAGRTDTAAAGNDHER